MKISVKISRDRDEISDLIIFSILVDVMYIEIIRYDLSRFFLIKRSVVHKIIDYIFRVLLSRLDLRVYHEKQRSAFYLLDLRR